MIKNNLLPAFAWLGASLFFIHPAANPFSYLLILRAAIIFGCLLVRVMPSRQAPNYQRVISWGSTILPCFLRATFNPADLGSIVGFILMVMGTVVVGHACVDLNRSFGVSPASRPFTSTGIYRWLRHPMYLGHLVCEMGFIVAAPSTNNILIGLSCWLLYSVRKQWEKEFYLSERSDFTFAK